MKNGVKNIQAAAYNGARTVVVEGQDFRHTGSVILKVPCSTVYIPYARHYNPRFVYFLPHFSVRFIIKRG